MKQYTELIIIHSRTLSPDYLMVKFCSTQWGQNIPTGALLCSNNDKNWSIYKAQNLVCTYYSKCTHAYTHTDTCTHEHTDYTKLNLHTNGQQTETWDMKTAALSEPDSSLALLRERPLWRNSAGLIYCFFRGVCSTRWAQQYLSKTDRL